MIALDTNVLVRYLVRDDFDHSSNLGRKGRVYGEAI